MIGKTEGRTNFPEGGGDNGRMLSIQKVTVG